MRREQSSAQNGEEAKYLKIITRLLIEQQVSAQKMTMTEAIIMLNSMGLGPTEIGQIIGWSKGSIGNVLSNLKKRDKK
jgi:hypothetical protein